LLAKNEKKRVFDEWPEKYDRWFTTPIGGLVKKCEAELLLDLLRPSQGEIILDAGCGTGVFTLDFLSRGAKVIGLDISLPMLRRSREKAGGYSFQSVLGDMLNLPFSENAFHKVISVTALEFIADGATAIGELFRVAQKGGCIVVATLNSLSPWAACRKSEAKQKESIFEKVLFRSPDELRSLAHVDGVIRTAIHFQKEDDPGMAATVEREGCQKGLDTGAFIAARWNKDF
jgi:ubiquinone/menaquinone biosynthesis C-methylase UbiE